MIKCTTIGIEPSPMCYEICVLAHKCGALKTWENKISTKQKVNIMTRCDYCVYRNSWDCGDGWYRCSNNILCDNFKLDFDMLTLSQQKTIQKILMEEDE